MTNVEINLITAIELMNEDKLTYKEKEFITGIQKYTKWELIALSKKEYLILRKISNKKY